MKANTRILLASAACLIGGNLVLAQETPSAPPAAPLGAAPGQSYVMMAGHWDSDAGQWKWVAAHWEQPPSTSAVWVAGHWISQSGKWVWVNGAWNVGNAQETQAGPPQPPSLASGAVAMEDQQAGDAAPAPTSAAPYVDGQYGPGGVTRTIDQGDVVTDYGPAGYYYPDYGWAGDPWYWGGGFVSVGFGPRFYGGGYYHGGYRRDGYYRGGYARGGVRAGAGAAGHFGGGHH